MNRYVRIMGIILFSTWVWNIQAQTASAFTKHWKMGVNASTGSCDITGAESTRYWKDNTGGALGVNAYYWHTPSLNVKAGLSWQYFTSKQVIYHPYPYVMNVDYMLQTMASRVSLGCDKSFLYNPELGTTLLAGLGLYTDLILDAKAEKNINYITQTVNDNVDVGDSFPVAIPGAYLNLGFQHQSVRFELFYWHDLRSFSLPTVPMGSEKRNCIGVNGTMFLPDSILKHFTNQ